MKAVVLDGFTLYQSDDPRWDRLRQTVDLEVFDRTAPELVVERIGDAEAVLTNKVVIDEKTMDDLPNLRYIGVLATGYNVVDISAARARGIVVTNIPSYSTMSVAQHVFALILTITNRTESYARANREGRWSASPDFSWRLDEWPELAGKRMGIMGLGHIGAMVAKIADAMGMEVAVCTSKPQEKLPQGYRKVSLNELFQTADILSLHCPLTPDTRHLVNRERLAMMKPTAILINTSRGPVVDEQALWEALRDHKIAAAGLDVLTAEPPKADNPLLSLDNCYVTPHIAWASAESRERLLELAAGNLKAFLAGLPTNVVN